MKILIVGGGNMGRTYAESFVSNHSVARRDLFILEKAEDKRPYFLSLGFECVESSPGPFISEMNLVIFAVKPQDTLDLFDKISHFMKEDQLVFSIMAGVRIETLKKALPTTKIIRAMPNLPAQVGMGMTGFTADASVSRTELFSVQNLLNTTGKSLYFDDESLLDGVTAISGSGPAYVYYFMQAMIDSATQMGFSPTEAETLVEQTFLGAIHLLSNNNFTCREWIGKVSSKGGTTEAAIQSFESGHVTDQIKTGLQAALKRSVELGS
jgi:pyrroline-5-carboxylate reductase